MTDDSIVRGSLFDDDRRERTTPDRAVLSSHLQSVLIGRSLDEVAHFLTDEFQMAVEYFRLVNGQNTGQRISLLFNPHRLSCTTKRSKVSCYEAMQSARFIDGLARSILSRSKERIRVSDMLYRVLEWGFNGVQFANEFPPAVARKLALQYGADRDSRVLDPCAGWGGRMIGLSTVSDRYVGYEPARQTLRGLRRLSTQLTKFSPGFQATTNRKPYEDAQLQTGRFDFALTSPPYYDTEVYTDEPDNSLNRYATFDDWTEGFYRPLLLKTMDALKPGATFVLNIGSRNYPLSDLMRETLDGYRIDRLGSLLSGKAGLGKSGEGETFYAIRK